MGRHMFGPPPDAKEKAAWKGWWGKNPPYHHPVFVLTHEKKAFIDMEGGTSFTFVNDGIESALKLAFAAANGKDVRLAGGADTVRQYLKAGLIDELHLVQVPLLMGQGERIFEGLGGVEHGLASASSSRHPECGVPFAHGQKESLRRAGRLRSRCAVGPPAIHSADQQIGGDSDHLTADFCSYSHW